MKDILLKLANGENFFNCEWRGKNNECEILILNIQTNKAFVRFKTPVKKVERREVEDSWGLDRDDNTPMEDIEVETSEEWISLPEL